MRVNFIYSNLNPCGGGERLTLITMEALMEIDVEIDLTTLEKPTIPKSFDAYGEKLGSIINKINRINILDCFNIENISRISNNNYDLTINTHGDIDPYYHVSFSPSNAITYCHYPTANFYQ